MENWLECLNVYGVITVILLAFAAIVLFMAGIFCSLDWIDDNAYKFPKTIKVIKWAFIWTISIIVLFGIGDMISCAIN